MTYTWDKKILNLFIFSILFTVINANASSYEKSCSNADGTILFLQELSSPSKVVLVVDYKEEMRENPFPGGIEAGLRVFVNQWSFLPNRVGMRDNNFWQQTRDLINGEDVHINLTKRDEIEKTYGSTCVSENEWGNSYTKTTSLEDITISNINAASSFSNYLIGVASDRKTINGTVICQEKSGHDVKCDD